MHPCRLCSKARVFDSGFRTQILPVQGVSYKVTHFLTATIPYFKPVKASPGLARARKGISLGRRNKANLSDFNANATRDITPARNSRISSHRRPKKPNLSSSIESPGPMVSGHYRSKNVHIANETFDVDNLDTADNSTADNSSRLQKSTRSDQERIRIKNL